MPWSAWPPCPISHVTPSHFPTPPPDDFGLRIRSARFAPPWIETDKEVRGPLAERDAVLARAPRSRAIGRERDRAELARIVTAANAAIVRLNHEAPTERQHRRLLDLERELEALARAHAEG